jgi:hypothetical protein
MLREEYRLRVSENRMLRRIFGLKKDEVTGEWRKLHHKDHCNQAEEVEMRGACRRNEPRMGYWWESQRERDR